MSPRTAAGLLLLLACVLTGPARGDVRVWEDELVLPSYRLDAPDPNPMFYTGASYQGAQKRIYPYALQDGITGEKRDEAFTALYLENEYVKLCVLPQIGGRLFYATDKTNGYDFFYRQHVIKPALIGMLGAWISGGIEWCVFHHHRNTTHMPVDYALAENPDGSGTIWIGETERRHRMRWIIGLTLHPGRSFIEATVKMFNRTAVPHSILYWANVAVGVNDDYQVIFPPSVQVATYHAKNDFVNWPIGSGWYRGSDYRGVDLSWWKNHPKAVSCFAWDLREDFMGGYDHRRQAGVVHVANHHIVSGAKLWEWAPGNIWDTKVLTDADGSYAEIMVGAYSDNQPDYSWIKPYEVKQFSQHWYPVREIGGFRKANLDAAVNLTLDAGRARVGLHTTSVRDGARVLLTARGKTLLEEPVDIAPSRPLVRDCPVPDDVEPTELEVKLLDAEGNVLIAYRPIEREPVKELPARVEPPPDPGEIRTVEELYLAGLRVEQLHNPSIDPMRYYEEALARDPSDARTNTVVGIRLSRQHRFRQAEEHLRRAVARLTTDYTRSMDGAPLFHLGVALKAQERWDEACDSFYRATWDAAFAAPGYLELAMLSCRQGRLPRALEEVDASLAANARNTRGLNVKTAILRRLGRISEALRVCREALAADPLDVFAKNERALLKKRRAASHPREDPQSYLELATDYMAMGYTVEASGALLSGRKSDGSWLSPLIPYYLGYLSLQEGRSDTAAEYFSKAGALPHEYCFPFRWESEKVLRAAVELRPQDSRAWYYLGNLLYDLRPEEAMAHWEEARRLDPSLAIVHRNLGWGALRHRGDVEAAIASYEEAIRSDPRDPRYYLELDDLYDRGNIAPAKRLAVLEAAPSVALERGSLLIREISLLVRNGRYDRAIRLLTENVFVISEGGGRELGDAYTDACLLRGVTSLDEGDVSAALRDVQAAVEYPENLSQESPRNERRLAHVQFYLGRASELAGDAVAAEEHYRAATRSGRGDDARFYQALAWRELGEPEKAGEIGSALVASATERIQSGASIDFFAKFGEQMSRRRQQAQAYYALGLGLLLAEKRGEAKRAFEDALKHDESHVWAAYQGGRLASP